MLEGTDLNNAYSLLGEAHNDMDYGQLAAVVGNTPSPPPRKSTPIKDISNQDLQIEKVQQAQQQLQQQQQVTRPTSNQQPSFDPDFFNKQFIAAQQMRNTPQYVYPAGTQYAAPIMQYNISQEPSYLDRLGSKKKEVLKFIQSGLIILFAISLHFIVDSYLKHYLHMYDITFGREMIIRILYSVLVVFVAWNIIIVK